MGTKTGNGYFASWALVYGSAMTLGMKTEAFGSTIKGLGAVMGKEVYVCCTTT